MTRFAFYALAALLLALYLTPSQEEKDRLIEEISADAVADFIQDQRDGIR